MMKKKIIIIFCTIAILFGFIFLYARYVGTKGLIVKEYKIIADVPEEFNGFKIIHFSDLHYGSTITKSDLNKIVDKMNLIKPDIVVFTGDLSNYIDNNIKKDLIECLSKIDSKIGKYAVNGNWDNEEFESIMTESGFIFLNNNYDLIYNEGNTPIFIAGITSVIYDNTNINEKTKVIYEYLEQNEISYKILLLHEPDTIDNINGFNLYLAGHSHNGQVKIPILTDFIKINQAKKYYKEYYKIDQKEVYISGGLGTSKIKVRLFNKPSFNFYRIVKE